MPEPLTIVTSTIAFVTALVTIRNTVTRILEDYDAIKYRSDKLIPTAIRLKKLCDDISRWQEDWHIYDRTPDLLPMTYWGGRRECTLIEGLLEQAYTRSRQIQGDFVFRLQEKSKSKVKEALRAVLTEPVDQKHLEKLEEWVELLQKYSKNLFIDHVNKGVEKGWETRRTSVQAQVYLICLATEYSYASALLHRFLIGRKTHVFDLYLSPNVEASKHVDRLAKIVRKHALEFRLSSMSVHKHSFKDVEICCSMPLQVDDLEFQDILTQQYESLFDFTTHAENERNIVAQHSTQQVTPSTSLWEIKPGPTPNKSGIGEIENLRSFMIRRQPDVDEFLQGSFSQRERYKLAYQLAEWAFVFLRTEWYADICSCRIFRMENDDLKTTFRSRIGTIAHQDTAFDRHLKNKSQWCEGGLQKMHICRLGVLLMEIAVGSPVPDIILLEDNELEIDEVLDVANPENTPVLRRKEINQKVRRAMGTKFMKVVDYCLQQRLHPWHITEANIHEFYSNVVYPLFQYYHRYYIKPLETDDD